MISGTSGSKGVETLQIVQLTNHCQDPGGAGMNFFLGKKGQCLFDASQNTF